MDNTRFLAPFWEFAGRPLSEHDDGWSYNELGFRGPLPGDKGDETRAIMLGGSTVVQGNPPLPELMTRRTGWDWYNFGGISWLSGQALSLMVHCVNDYDPDILVYYGCGNDLFCPWFYDPRPGFPYDFMRRQGFTEDDMPTLRAAVGHNSDEWEWGVVDALRSNLDRMRQYSPGRFVAVLQPMLGYEAFGEYLERQIERIRGSVDIDLSCCDVGVDDFSDFIHLRASGNRIVADALAEAL